MSAALDVRKCFALASLFACGQSDGVRVAQKCAVRSIARKPRCPQKKEKARKVRAYLFVVRSTQNKWVLTHLVRCTDTACLFVCYVRCARFLQMLCACSSLFACGLPRLAHQRLLPKVNRVQRTVPVPTMQALLPANCSICRGSSSSVSAKKEKTRTKFVLIFLWCGHRDLNSDGVTIRPSNVRVCLFRHDRLTLLII